MKDSDRIRIQHMLDAAREALSFAHGRRREDLPGNRMLALSLIKDVEIIGEAATKISLDLKQANPEVRWPEIIGMRNRLIHAYFDINFDILWDTVVSVLPVLSAQLEALLDADE